MLGFASSSSRSSSELSPTQQNLHARPKTKFCMYHLQGVCKFVNGGCSFAHCTEEMHGGRVRKTRRQRGHVVAAATEDVLEYPPGNVEIAAVAYKGESFRRQFPRQVHPASVAETYEAAPMAEEYFVERGQKFSELPDPSDHGLSKLSMHSKLTLAPPPGLAPTQVPPLPDMLPLPCFPETPPDVIDLTQEGCWKLGAAKLLGGESAGDARATEVGTSEVELNMLANLVHSVQRALLMSSPGLRDDLASSLLLGPPGLTSTD